MKKLINLFPLLIIFLLYSCNTGNKTSENLEVENYFSVDSTGIAVMAYYMPRNNFSPSEIPVGKLTHIIFSFTEIIDNRMAFRQAGSGDKLRDLVIQKQRNPGLKVMVACGGWGGSGGFSDMAASEANRKIFVESVIEFINEYDLDGLDIDWEYPGLPGIGNPYRQEDRENFTALMKELREAMDDTGRELTLTFAAAAWDEFFDHIETNKVINYADYMNLMTYDFTGGSTPFTMHHTNLGLITLEDFIGSPIEKFINDSLAVLYPDWHPRSIEGIIDFCEHLGVNTRQMVIGAAFYGKSWKVNQTVNNGLYQPADGPQNGWPSYSQITNDIIGRNG
ncbi:MAG TPA: chitinase, partial [Bacteroidales bacterium]|nr:chitinase [Bacteroidales bacterium]